MWVLAPSWPSRLVCLIVRVKASLVSGAVSLFLSATYYAKNRLNYNKSFKRVSRVPCRVTSVVISLGNPWPKAWKCSAWVLASHVPPGMPDCPIARNPATFSISISLRQTARATAAAKNQKRKHKHEKRKQSQNGNKNSKRQKANSNNDDNNESEILHKDRCRGGGGGGNSTLDQPSARPLAMLMLLSPSRAEPSPESGNNCSNAAKTLTN